MEENIYDKYYRFICSIINKTVVDPFNEQSREDYLQECYLGLLEAIDRFDETKSSFSNYAYIKVRGRLLDYLRKQSKLTRADAKALSIMRDVLNKHGTLEFELVNKEGSISKDRYYRLLPLVRNEQLVDEYLFVDYDICEGVDNKIWIDKNNKVNIDMFIESKFIHKVHQRKVKNRVDKVLDKLTARERTLIKLKYYHDKSLTEISEIFGVTIAAVSHMHKKAIKKLKNNIGDNINEYLYD